MRKALPAAIAAAALISGGWVGETAGLTVVTRVPVGNGPTAVAAGAGAIWVTNVFDNTVSRIDPATNRVVATIPVGIVPLAVGATETAVWVSSHGDRTLMRIDPATNEVVATIRVGKEPDAIAVGERAVWVANFAELGAGSSVMRIDPATNKVVATIRVSHPSAIAAGRGAVWALGTESYVLSRIDPATNRVAGTVRVGKDPPGALPRSVAVGARGVWVTDSLRDTVIRVDPSRDRVTATLKLAVDRGDSDHTRAVATGAGAVWVATRGHVLRIDPRTKQVVAVVRVGKRNRGLVSDGLKGLVVAGDALWVADADANVVYRLALG